MIAAVAFLTTATVFGPVPYAAAIAALGSATAVSIVSKQARKGGGRGRGLRNLVLVLSLCLAWSLRAVGMPWPAAGLAAGLAMGAGRRRSTEAERQGSFERISSKETGYALAFVAGFGVPVAGLSTALPGIAVFAVGVLAAAAIGTLIAGNRTFRLPAEAVAFSALIAAKRAGLVDDAAIAGFALAYLVATPFARKATFPGFAPATRHAMKAVVGISPKGDPLGALSFASALGQPGEPLRAVCVASTEDGVGPSPRDAEEALVRCVATGAAADIRILPSVVVSASVPDGLARAALERRADALVLGSGDAIADILVAFPGSVVEIRRPESFSSSRRLVTMTVAGAEKSPGFLLALEAVARAWGSPVASLEALMIGAPASTLVEAARGLLDPRRVGSVPAWRDIPAAIDARSSREASLAVLLSRPGAKAWNPGHERLPVILDASFPDASIALWYLPGTPGDASAISGDTAPSSAEWPPLIGTAFDSGRVFVDMREAALVDAIRCLTDSMFPGARGTSGRLAAVFSGVARKEPIELAPGILLLHAHSDGIDEPTVAIGSRPAGWPLAALATPVLITVALVSPADSGPEIHLEALTQIASAFRSLGLAERLLSAAQPARTTGRNNTIA
jgi:hypothetical protein